MKRHPSLIPLSRFHRSVLFLALVCKKNAPSVKGYPQDLEGKRDYAIAFFQEQLKAHMQLEEESLFPQVKGKSAEIDELMKELCAEHRQLESLIAALPDSTDLSDGLDEFGQLLEKHVRKEERQFFQRIQDTLSVEELLQLAI